jgi:hypothetical protein
LGAARDEAAEPKICSGIQEPNRWRRMADPRTAVDVYVPGFPSMNFAFKMNAGEIMIDPGLKGKVALITVSP